jgi:hypothetical protein
VAVARVRRQDGRRDALGRGLGELLDRAHLRGAPRAIALSCYRAIAPSSVVSKLVWECPVLDATPGLQLDTTRSLRWSWGIQLDTTLLFRSLLPSATRRTRNVDASARALDRRGRPSERLGAERRVGREEKGRSGGGGQLQRAATAVQRPPRVTTLRRRTPPPRATPRALGSSPCVSPSRRRSSTT